MSRRKIVVEGVTYGWETDGHYLKIIPPKGQGSSRMFNPHEFDGPQRPYDIWDDERTTDPVHPGLVARHIYRHFLGREMPEKERTPPRPKGEYKIDKVRRRMPRWATCPELPRSYLVQARLTGKDGRTVQTLPLEVHDDQVTAGACAEQLESWRVRNAIDRDRQAPMTFDMQGSEGGGRITMTRLRAWLIGMTPEGKGPLPDYVVDTVELPFKMALAA